MEEEKIEIPTVEIWLYRNFHMHNPGKTFKVLAEVERQLYLHSDRKDFDANLYAKVCDQTRWNSPHQKAKRQKTDISSFVLDH